MAFNVQEVPFSYTNFQKKTLPTVGGGTPSQTLPRSVTSFPRFNLPPPPLLKKNHGYASANINVTMHSSKSHHDFCSYRIRRPTRNRWPRSEGLGGGGRTRKAAIFSASKLAQSYKS